MSFSRFKGDIFVQDKLKENHQHDGEDFGDDFVHVELVNAEIEYQIAQEQSAEADHKKDGESSWGFILYLEIEIPV